MEKRPFEVLSENSSKSVRELIALLQQVFGMTKKDARETINAWVRA